MDSQNILRREVLLVKDDKIDSFKHAKKRKLNRINKNDNNIQYLKPIDNPNHITVQSIVRLIDGTTGIVVELNTRNIGYRLLMDHNKRLEYHPLSYINKVLYTKKLSPKIKKSSRFFEVSPYDDDGNNKIIGSLITINGNSGSIIDIDGNTVIVSIDETEEILILPTYLVQVVE